MPCCLTIIREIRYNSYPKIFHALPLQKSDQTQYGLELHNPLLQKGVHDLVGDELFPPNNPFQKMLLVPRYSVAIFR